MINLSNLKKKDIVITYNLDISTNAITVLKNNRVRVFLKKNLYENMEALDIANCFIQFFGNQKKGTTFTELKILEAYQTISKAKPLFGYKKQAITEVGGNVLVKRYGNDYIEIKLDTFRLKMRDVMIQIQKEKENGL